MKGMSDAKLTTHQINSLFWSSKQNERINQPEWTWIDQSKAVFSKTVVVEVVVV